MSDLVGIKWKFPDWETKLKRAMGEVNLFIAAQMQFNRGMLFDQEGAYNGRSRWDDLILRNGMILSRRGTLRKSIAPYNPKGRPGPDGIVKIAGDTITIGTKLAYARMMNNGTVGLPGGVLRAKNAKALKIPIPQGESAGPGAKKIQAAALEPKLQAAAKRLARARTQNSREAARKTMDRLRKRLESGRGPVNFIFRKSVKIKPRPFDTWNDEDQKELEIALRNKLVEILQR